MSNEKHPTTPLSASLPPPRGKPKAPQAGAHWQRAPPHAIGHRGRPSGASRRARRRRHRRGRRQIRKSGGRVVAAAAAAAAAFNRQQRRGRARRGEQAARGVPSVRPSFGAESDASAVGAPTTLACRPVSAADPEAPRCGRSREIKFWARASTPQPPAPPPGFHPAHCAPTSPLPADLGQALNPLSPRRRPPARCCAFLTSGQVPRLGKGGGGVTMAEAWCGDRPGLRAAAPTAFVHLAALAGY